MIIIYQELRCANDRLTCFDLLYTVCLRGGVQKKCVNKVNQWSQVVPMVEVNGDPRGADFFLSFGLFLWPKTASKCHKSGISGHKPPWWLQIGCTAWIKVGSQQETSGPMCRNHFWDLKLP